MLLRKVRQKPNENIQVYAERMLALAKDAFIGQMGDSVQTQLVGFFIDGLAHDYTKMKVMRENPANLQAAITVATTDLNLQKRFDLRTNSHGAQRQGFHTDNCSQEPMEVNHARNQRCFACHRSGHKAKDCRSRQQSVNAIRNNPGTSRGAIVCWNCNKTGHTSRRCRAKKVVPQHTGNRPGQVQGQEN